MANVPFRNLELSNLSFRQLQYVSTNNTTAPNGFILAGVNNSIIPRDPLPLFSTYSGIDLAYMNSTISTQVTIIPIISTNAGTAITLAQSIGPSISSYSTSLGSVINTFSNATGTSIVSLGNSISSVSTFAGVAQNGVNSLGISLSTVSTTAGYSINMTTSISSISTLTGQNIVTIQGLGNTISSQSTVLGHVEIGLSTVSTSAALNIGPTGATGPTGPTGDSAQWALYPAVADVLCGYSTLRDIAQLNQGTSNLLAAEYGAIFGQFNSTFGLGSFVAGRSNMEFGSTNIVAAGHNFVSTNNAAVLGLSNYVVGPGSLTMGLNNSTINRGGYCEGSGNRVNGDYAHAEGLSNIVDGTYSHVEGFRNLVSTGFNHVIGISNIVISGSNNVVGGANNTVTNHSNFVFGFGSSNGGFRNIIFGTGNRTKTGANDNLISGSNNTVERTVTSLIAGNANYISSIASASVGARSIFVTGESNTVLNSFTYTDGVMNSTIGYGSHVEGLENISFGSFANVRGLTALNRIPTAQTYANGFFFDPLNVPLKGSAQTNVLTLTAGTATANTYKFLRYWEPNQAMLNAWNTGFSTMSTIVMSNDGYPMAQTYNIALTGYNSNNGGAAGKGYYYGEYRASLYFDTPTSELYIGNLVGATFTAATSSPVTLTAANVANNLANAPTITVRARANVISAFNRAAQIAFEVASTDARITNFYAHVRIDEMLRPQIDPYF